MHLAQFSTCCGAFFLIFSFLPIFLELFSFSFLAGAVQSFECQEVWDGQSKDNELSSCVTDFHHVISLWRSYIWVFAALLFFVLTVLVIPFICCGCFCSCCRCCCTWCKKKSQKKCDTGQSLLLSVFVVLGAVAVGILMIAGGIVGRRTTIEVYDDGRGTLLDFLTDRKNQIYDSLIDYSTDPPSPPSINFDDFDYVLGNISETADDYQDWVYNGSRAFLIVGIVGGALAVFFSLISLLGVICSWRLCACRFGWLIYFFAVVFCIVAIAGAVLTFAVGGVCAEVQLQYYRHPGVFQWYFLPIFNDKIGFAELFDEVTDLEVKASEEACNQLLNICGPSGSSTKPFVCPDGFTSTSSCQSFKEVQAIYYALYLQPSLVSSYCPAPSDHQGPWLCTIDECAVYCSEDKAKTAASKVSNTASYARNASVSVSLVLPIVSADFTLDLGASLFLSRKFGNYLSYTNRKVTRCSDLYTSVYVLTVGFFVGAFLLLLALLVLVWIRPITPKDKLEEKKNPLQSTIDQQKTCMTNSLDNNPYPECTPPGELSSFEALPTNSPESNEAVLLPMERWY